MIPQRQLVTDGDVTGSAVVGDQLVVARPTRLQVENVVWIWPEQQVARILAEKFGQVPQVRSVCAQFDADGYTVWTIMDSHDDDARDEVYDREMQICEELNLHDFDFRVTSIDLVAPEELVGTGFTEIFKR